MPLVRFSKAGGYLNPSRRTNEDNYFAIAGDDGLIVPIRISQAAYELHNADEEGRCTIVEEEEVEEEAPQAEEAPRGRSRRRGRKGREGSGPVSKSEV